MKLLLAEDDAMLADALQTQLGGAGFAVEHAPNGAVADYLLHKQPFDIAVLDIGLPMLDGLAVLQQVRQHQPSLPVVLLTARDALADRVAGLQAGADDYVTKPFGLEELLLRVGAILRRTKALIVENSVLRCGALALDEDQHKVFYGEEEIELSPTEFKLLQELMRSKGRVLTKSALLRDVWEIDFETETSVLDTYISYLRKKLNRDGLEFIRTVRGVGYQIVEPA